MTTPQTMMRTDGSRDAKIPQHSLDNFDRLIVSVGNAE
jgi:hypothetical protein